MTTPKSVHHSEIVAFLMAEGFKTDPINDFFEVGCDWQSYRNSDCSILVAQAEGGAVKVADAVHDWDILTFASLSEYQPQYAAVRAYFASCV